MKKVYYYTLLLMVNIYLYFLSESLPYLETELELHIDMLIIVKMSLSHVSNHFSHNKT